MHESLALVVIGYALMAATLAYAIAAFWAARSWHRRPPSADSSVSPVSMLKPLCGDEPGLYDRLRSFCVQGHACVQLVFGVNDPDDPALLVVARLRREFPAVDIVVVAGTGSDGANPKIANLSGMLAAASHAVLILSDSDVRVAADYARVVSAPLADPAVGLVTCLYRGVPQRGLWSWLGAAFINGWFLPAALLEWRFGGATPAFGPTIVLRREVLDRIGGFAAVAGYLADDYVLGQRVAALGLRCVLSPCVVETAVVEDRLVGLWRRELRWMRTFRSLRPAAHVFLPLSLGVPLTAVGLVLAGVTWPAIALALAAVLARSALPLALRAVFPVPAWRHFALAWLCLMPLRDSLSVLTWAASLLTRTVYWRGRRYAVERGGKLTSPR